MALEATYRLANGLGRTTLRALGARVVVHGAEHLPRTGPVVVASTHGSFLDFVVLEKAAIGRGRRLRFLIRHDIWVPGVGRALDGMRHVPVDREAPAAAYLRARALLGEGRALGIFPEAGISHSHTVRALMPGAAALAAATGAPLVPVALWGAQRIASVAARPDLTRGRRVDVAVGAPVAVDDDFRATTTRLGHAMTVLLEGLQRRPEHAPRPGEHAFWHPAHLGGAAPDRQAAAALDDLPRGALSPTWGPAAPAPDAAADAASPAPG